MLFPLTKWTGRIASGLGPRSVSGGSSFHRGLDLPAPLGSPVLAPESGVITMIGKTYSYSGASDSIYLKGEKYSYVFFHSRAVVKAGERVKEGDVISHIVQDRSYSKKEGRWVVLGAHLHLEIVSGTPKAGALDGSAFESWLREPQIAAVIGPSSSGYSTMLAGLRMYGKSESGAPSGPVEAVYAHVDSTTEEGKRVRAAFRSALS